MDTYQAPAVVPASSAIPPGVQLRRQVNISRGSEDNKEIQKTGVKGLWNKIAYPVRLYKAFDAYTKPLQEEYFSQCALIRMVSTQQSDKLKYDYLQGQSKFTTNEHDVQTEMPWQTEAANPFPKDNRGTIPIENHQRRLEYQRLSKELKHKQEAHLKAAWDSLMLETKRIRSEMLDIVYDDENHFRESINAAIVASRVRIASAADTYDEASKGKAFNTEVSTHQWGKQ
jgi:hypothetical protein